MRTGVCARDPSLLTRLHDTKGSVMAGPELSERHWGLSLQKPLWAAPASGLSSCGFQPQGHGVEGPGVPGPGLGLSLSIIQDRLEFLPCSSGFFSTLHWIVKGNGASSPALSWPLRTVTPEPRGGARWDGRFVEQRLSLSPVGKPEARIIGMWGWFLMEALRECLFLASPGSWGADTPWASSSHSPFLECVSLPSSSCKHARHRVQGLP